MTSQINASKIKWQQHLLPKNLPLLLCVIAFVSHFLTANAQTTSPSDSEENCGLDNDTALGIGVANATVSLCALIGVSIYSFLKMGTSWTAKKYFKDLKSKKQCFYPIIANIFDQSSDIGFICGLYGLAVYELEDKENDCESVNALYLFLLSLSIFVFYRLVSGIVVWLGTRNGYYATGQFFVELMLYRAVWVNYKLKCKKPCSPQRWIQNMEAMLEAFPQLIIQMFFMLQRNETELFVLFSVFVSMISMTNKAVSEDKALFHPEWQDPHWKAKFTFKSKSSSKDSDVDNELEADREYSVSFSMSELHSDSDHDHDHESNGGNTNDDDDDDEKSERMQSKSGIISQNDDGKEEEEEEKQAQVVQELIKDESRKSYFPCVSSNYVARVLFRIFDISSRTVIIVLVWSRLGGLIAGTLGCLELLSLFAVALKTKDSTPLTWLAILPINGLEHKYLQRIHVMVSIFRFLEHLILIICISWIQNSKIYQRHPFYYYAVFSFIACFSMYIALIYRKRATIVDLVSTNRTLRDMIRLHLYDEIQQMELFGYKYKDSEWQDVVSIDSNSEKQAKYSICWGAMKHANSSHVVLKMLSHHENVNDILPDTNDDTFLTYGAKNSMTDVIDVLIQSNVNVDYPSSYSNSTALIAATRKGNVEIVEKLLQANANINAKTIDGETAFSVAVMQSNWKIAEKLIKVSDENDEMVMDRRWASDIKTDGEKIMDGAGEFLLVMAKRSNFPIISRLIQANVDINYKNAMQGETAMTLAATNGNVEIVKALIGAKGNVEDKNIDQETALMIAAKRGKIEVVDILINANAKINSQNIQRENALMLASRNGHTEIVRTMIEHKAKIDTINNKGENALMIAIESAIGENRDEIIEQLIQENIDMKQKNIRGENALMIATRKLNKNIVQRLIETKKINVNEPNNDRKTPVSVAVDNSSWGIVKILLEANANITEVLTEAVQNRNHNLLNRLMQDDLDVDMTQFNSNGFTPLMVAANQDEDKKDEKKEEKEEKDGQDEESDPDLLKILIGKGELDKQNDHGENALMIAARKGNGRVAEALIDAKVDLNKENKLGETAIAIAAANDHWKIVERLMAEGADTVQLFPVVVQKKNHELVEQLMYGENVNEKIDLNGTTKKGYTALMIAVQKGNHEMVEQLIKSKVDLNKQNASGHDALTIAAKNDHWDIAKMLMEANASTVKVLHDIVVNDNHQLAQKWINAGIDINQDLNDCGDTALIIATKLNKLNCAVVLCVAAIATANIDLGNNFNKTALMYAAQNGHYQIFQMLIKANADVNRINVFGETALTLAAKGNNIKCAKDLIEKILDSHSQSIVIPHVLINAVRIGSYSSVKSCLKANIDVNEKDELGNNALMIATKRNKVKIVKVLVKAKINVNTRNIEGETALMMAANNGNNKIAKILVQSKLNVNLNDKNNKGQTALMLAVSNGNEEVVSLLLNNGAVVDEFDYDGNTALHMALKHDIVEQLIEFNANVNARNKNGNTPLLTHASRQRNQHVKQFIEKKANINEQNNDEDTPLIVATKNARKNDYPGAYKDIINSLLNAKAKINICNKNGENVVSIARKNSHVGNHIRKKLEQFQMFDNSHNAN